MRYAAFVALAAFAVAFTAAVIGDAATEAFANLTAGHAVDAHHESLAPGACLSAAFIAIICAFAASAGRARAEAFARMLARRPLRVLFFIATAILTIAIVMAMEGYETRFGGASVFDARSVLAHHLLPSLAAYACVVVLADRLLRLCVRAALAGWEALLCVDSPFVRSDLGLSAHVSLDSRDQHSLAADPGRTHPSWSLRAPPVHGYPISVALLRRIPWSTFARARAYAQSSSFFF